MERLLTFIDVDENRLELWLKPDRIQLVVIDSRPELEAGELRRFAAAVFVEYVGRDLAARLARAERALCAARERAAGGGAELAGAIDGALRAIGEAAAAVAVPVPEAMMVPDTEPDDIAAVAPPLAPPGARPGSPPADAPVRVLTGRMPYPPLKPRRGKRACESSELRWSVGGGPAR